MTFQFLASNYTLENRIIFQKQMIQILKDDIFENGDNGFGLKNRQLNNMIEDLEKLQNELKTRNS